MEDVMRRGVIALILASAVILSGCGAAASLSSVKKTVYVEDILNGTPEETGEELVLVAPGILTEECELAVIDYSMTAEGYVMMQYTGDTQNNIKAQVKGEETTYSYNLVPGQWSGFPLSEGDGYYQFSVLENVEGQRYALVLSTGTDVVLNNEFAPFTRPNQYVNYAEAPKTVAIAKLLAEDETDELKIVESVYDFVTGYLSYDKELAMTVENGYLPVLDEVLMRQKGICFDYAAVMTGMLRSLGIPCKLVVGYAGDAYHAWISVYVEGKGWIENVVYFDGNSWQRMDPTFASAGSSNNEFIGDGSNYIAKYFY